MRGKSGGTVILDFTRFKGESEKRVKSRVDCFFVEIFPKFDILKL